jgi:hypothetical protein
MKARMLVRVREGWKSPEGYPMPPPSCSLRIVGFDDTFAPSAFKVEHACGVCASGYPYFYETEVPEAFEAVPEDKQ